MEKEKELLEQFVVNNPDLERLENIINSFNIFEALDIVNYEIRHSAFLAWLMNPQETHGLGDYFLKSFLKIAAIKAKELGMKNISVVDIDYWDFDSSEVIREWRNIDILIRSDDHRFVCAIENKILSSEHNDQLQRYKQAIEHEFRNYNKKLFIYLTPEGETPSEDDYVPICYKELTHLIDNLLKNNQDKLSHEILTFISHYNDILRRYVVEDSELKNLCRKIYKKHKKALDLIFAYRPDKLLEIYEYLIEILKKDDDVFLDDSTKTCIRFIPKNLDFIPKKGSGWVKSNRMLLFEFKNNPDKLSLQLVIGPGPQEIRKVLYERAKENRKLFNTANRKLTDQFFTVFKKDVLNQNDHEDKEGEELKELLKQKFQKIKENDIPKIVKEIEKLKPELNKLQI